MTTGNNINWYSKFLKLKRFKNSPQKLEVKQQVWNFLFKRSGEGWQIIHQDKFYILQSVIILHVIELNVIFFY